MKILSACTADTAKIYHIMTGARSPAPDPGRYCTGSEDYIQSHIVDPGAGIIFRAVECDCLTTSFIIHFPDNIPDSLGHYMSLELRVLDRVARIDSLAVQPNFRGRGLRHQLTASAEQYLMTVSYYHLMGTIHPDDRYSLDNFLKLGCRVVTTTKKCGGPPHHVLYKSISDPPSFVGSGSNTASVSIYLK